MAASEREIRTRFNRLTTDFVRKSQRIKIPPLLTAYPLDWDLDVLPAHLLTSFTPR